MFADDAELFVVELPDKLPVKLSDELPVNLPNELPIKLPAFVAEPVANDTSMLVDNENDLESIIVATKKIDLRADDGVYFPTGRVGIQGVAGHDWVFIDTYEVVFEQSSMYVCAVIDNPFDDYTRSVAAYPFDEHIDASNEDMQQAIYAVECDANVSRYWSEECVLDRHYRDTIHGNSLDLTGPGRYDAYVAALSAGHKMREDDDKTPIRLNESQLLLFLWENKAMECENKAMKWEKKAIKWEKKAIEWENKAIRNAMQLYAQQKTHLQQLIQCVSVSNNKNSLVHALTELVQHQQTSVQTALKNLINLKKIQQSNEPTIEAPTEAPTIEATTIEATTIEATTIEAPTIEATTIEATTIEAPITRTNTVPQLDIMVVDNLPQPLLEAVIEKAPETNRNTRGSKIVFDRNQRQLAVQKYNEVVLPNIRKQYDMLEEEQKTRASKKTKTCEEDLAATQRPNRPIDIRLVTETTHIPAKKLAELGPPNTLVDTTKAIVCHPTIEDLRKYNAVHMTQLCKAMPVGQLAEPKYQAKSKLLTKGAKLVCDVCQCVTCECSDNEANTPNKRRR